MENVLSKFKIVIYWYIAFNSILKGAEMPNFEIYI